VFLCRTDGYNRRDSRLTNRGRRSVSQHIRLQVMNVSSRCITLRAAFNPLTPTVAVWLQL